jgi:hypothetical protein
MWDSVGLLFSRNIFMNLPELNHSVSVSYPMGTGGFSPGVKQLGREADHSPPTSAEVKKMWIYYIHFPIRLHGVVLN